MKNRIRLIVATLVVLAGASAWFFTRGGTTVQLVEVSTKEVVEVYIATARLNAGTVSQVGSELAGRIATVHVKRGDRPKAGHALVDLQPMDAKLSVQQAEARLAVAERELARSRTGASRAQVLEAQAAVSSAEATLQQTRSELARATAMAKDGIQTPAAVERATTDVRRAESQLDVVKARLSELLSQPRPEDIRVAQARVDEARGNVEQTNAALGKTTITAPFDGLVLSVDTAPGENVAPAQTLVTLAKMDAMEVYAEVDEDYFVRIAPGQKATLVFPSMPDNKYEAVVSQVGPEVDSERGVLAIHLAPQSLPAHVVPGLTVEVAIELKRLPNARSLPRTAVVYDANVPAVFVVENGIAKRRVIRVVAEGDEDLAVEGVDSTAVILEAARVQDGDQVRVGRPN